MTMKEITHTEAEQLITASVPNTIRIVDVRDENSFIEAHIPGATHLSMDILQAFCAEVEVETPVLVYCRHGISSQAVAQHLIERGFTNVYSLIGGFEEWRSHHPVSNTFDTEK